LTRLSRYDLAPLAWMSVLALFAAMLWTVAARQTLADYWSAEMLSVRDDAEAIIGRFGFPEADSATESPTGSDTRMFIYRERGVRVAFVRRATRKARSAWKLAGFLDLDRDLVVGGEEALKRLSGR
jgi:hypothetical protein